MLYQLNTYHNASVSSHGVSKTETPVCGRQEDEDEEQRQENEREDNVGACGTDHEDKHQDSHGYEEESCRPVSITNMALIEGKPRVP